MVAIPLSDGLISENLQWLKPYGLFIQHRSQLANFTLAHRIYRTTIANLTIVNTLLFLLFPHCFSLYSNKIF